MKIVEYSDNLAGKVAEMWNKSNSNWGNESKVYTAEGVKNQESSSGNIKLYLAIDNDEVVGYCSFSEYSGDEQTSYLPLLNVRPDYHGKKVGKELVLRVIDDAIRSKWPRFDLYTWSGNIKAMPLYKKCGFFWEKINDRVHLMNFLPYIYQTEALKPYLNQIDWYKDSKRVIDMNQDGDMRGEFDIYSYQFENDKTTLELEFERKGRGLTLIQTPEYKVEMKMDRQDLVFGETYEVVFEVVSKTADPVEIKIVGKDNKNITFDFSYEGSVTDEVIKGEFFVGQIEKDQEELKTHPVVDADVYINGKMASFKIGVNPKFPIKTKLVIPDYQLIKGKEYTAYVDLVNNYNESKVVEISMQDSFVEFSSIQPITLSKKEKQSIPVTYRVNDFGFYEEDIELKIGKRCIKNKIRGIFNGHASTFTADTDYGAVVVSGQDALIFEKDGKALVLVNNFSQDASSAILLPQIGVPYTKELHNVEPIVEFPSNNKMTITYQSADTPGATVKLITEHNYGIAEAYYELHYLGEPKEMQLVCPIWQILSNGQVPCNGEILTFNGYDGAGIGTIDESKLDEKWMFQGELNSGVSWEGNVSVADWKLTLETEKKIMSKGDVLRTPKVIFSNIHKNYKEFRKYLGYKEPRFERGFLEMNANSGNPFFEEDYEFSLENAIKKIYKGSMEIEGKVTKAFESVTLNNQNLVASLVLDDRLLTLKKRLFKTNGKVELSLNKGTHIVNNGVLEFKVDKEYSDSLISLKKDGVEWIDSNYPTAKERAWWGGWTGGSNVYMRNITDIMKQEEYKNVEFATATDNFGNVWEGIQTTLDIVKDTTLKGLTIKNFFLTLPGVNVMMITTKISNYTGKFMSNSFVSRMLAIQADEPKNNMIAHINGQKFRCFDKGVEQTTSGFAKFKSSRTDTFNYYVVNAERLLLETQTDFNCLWDQFNLFLADQESMLIGNGFVMIGEDLSEEEVKDLRNIKIEV